MSVRRSPTRGLITYADSDCMMDTANVTVGGSQLNAVPFPSLGSTTPRRSHWLWRGYAHLTSSDATSPGPFPIGGSIRRYRFKFHRVESSQRSTIVWANLKVICGWHNYLYTQKITGSLLCRTMPSPLRADIKLRDWATMPKLSSTVNRSHSSRSWSTSLCIMLYLRLQIPQTLTVKSVVKVVFYDTNKQCKV